VAAYGENSTAAVISEALALAESDLDRTCGAVLVRRGKGGRRREVVMDRWGKRRG
jgi:hypothetical protein